MASVFSLVVGRCVVGVGMDKGGLKTETVGITSKAMVFSI